MNSTIAACLVLALALSACVDQAATDALQREISETKSQIETTREDLSRWNEGSVLNAMVALRLSTQEQTLAMLEQKLAAEKYYPSFSYSVNAVAYVPPDDAIERVEHLARELDTAREGLKAAREKAKQAKGLLSVLSLTEAETKAIAVTQLEYQLSAYRNGFPPLFAPTAPVDPPKGTSAREASLEPSMPAALPIAPPKADVEREAMNAAVSFILRSKRTLPSDYSANRYKDMVTFVLEYSNNSEKEIRAITGHVSFKDIFDREFLRLSLTVDDPIPAGKTVTDSDKMLEVNQFNEAHKKLMTTEIENMTATFEPESIIFVDGTRLGSVN